MTVIDARQYGAVGGGRTGDPSVSPTLMAGDRLPLHMAMEGLTEAQKAGVLRTSPETTPERRPTRCIWVAQDLFPIDE
jgi:hypothetical protein